MRVEERGRIYDAGYAPPQERIAFFTNLCPLRDGTLLAACQVGSAKHAPDSTLKLFRSTDAGNNWSPLAATFSTFLDGIPGSLAGPALVEIEPKRLMLFATWFDRSEPGRPLFDPVTEGILHSRLLYTVSTDQGETFSAWTVVPTPGLTGCATTGPIVQWTNSAIAFPFESFKEFDDPNPGRHAAWIVFSRDGGRSFSEPRIVAQHPEHKIYYWDQRLAAGPRIGEAVALFWTHDLEQKKDLNVHLRKLAVTDRSVEVDTLRATSIPGQIAAPLLLSAKRMLAFVVDRSRPGTMTLCNSPDAGATWPEGDRLIVYTHDEKAAISQGAENIDFKQYWEDMGKWSFGHPALISLGQDKVLLAWYAGTPSCMSLHWARVELA